MIVKSALAKLFGKMFGEDGKMLGDDGKILPGWNTNDSMSGIFYVLCSIMLIFSLLDFIFQLRLWRLSLLVVHVFLFCESSIV